MRIVISLRARAVRHKVLGHLPPVIINGVQHQPGDQIHILGIGRDVFGGHRSFHETSENPAARKTQSDQVPGLDRSRG